MAGADYAEYILKAEAWLKGACLYNLIEILLEWGCDKVIWVASSLNFYLPLCSNYKATSMWLELRGR